LVTGNNYDSVALAFVSYCSWGWVAVLCR